MPKNTNHANRWSAAPLKALVKSDSPIIYGILQPGEEYSGGVPYVRPTEIVGDVIDAATLRRTSPTIADRYRRARLETNDIILTIVGTIGKVAIVPPNLAGANITQSSCRIRAGERVEHRYLAWFLRSPYARTQFGALSLGTAVQRLNLVDVREINVILAPPAEQRRIVEAIEAHLTQLDAAVAALTRVRTQLKRYRASVLKAACEGSLDGVELGAEGFQVVELADVVPSTGPIIYGILQPGPPQADGVPYVRPTEIANDQIVLAEVRKTTSEIAQKYARATLAAGDVIFTIVGTIGKVAIVPAALSGANITQSSARVRPKAGTITTAYLATLLRSPVLWSQINTIRLGTAVQRLNLKDLRELRVPVPSIDDQHRIVAEVERRLSIADEVAREVEAGLKRCARLRQAILKKAFEGRLVPQQPQQRFEIQP